MPKISLDFESIDKGTPLDGLSIPALTRITLARYAGSVDDYNPMHLDDKVAMASGKTSVFAPNNLVMAYVGRMVEEWFLALLCDGSGCVCSSWCGPGTCSPAAEW